MKIRTTNEDYELSFKNLKKKLKIPRVSLLQKQLPELMSGKYEN